MKEVKRLSKAVRQTLTFSFDAKSKTKLFDMENLLASVLQLQQQRQRCQQQLQQQQNQLLLN